jgi:protocatechuate 3,4-dioxygenase beta subunit
MTEGPFYFDAGQIRRDITEGRPGTPLLLALEVVNASSCSPIRDAVVDIWHCDAVGLYSGYGSEGTAGERFLRGIQVTDGSGRAEFETLYPGFYRGRTVHVHFKIHLDERTAATSQLFFPESVNDVVMATSPYNLSGTRDTRNSTDSIFTSATVVDVAADAGGYAASLVIGVSA